MAKAYRTGDLVNRKRLRVAGLMSGTSADGIDVAIVDMTEASRRLVAFDSYPYPSAVRKAVLRLCDPNTSSVDAVCHYNFLLGHLFAEAVIRICERRQVPLRSIDLIGSHGQTICHIPHGRRCGRDRIRSTLQIAEPSVIAERTGITTVADFRPRDIACGGQGAPLVPFADYILFSHPRQTRALQNIGGIANTTYLPAGGDIDSVLAFDSGPGNMVMDAVVSMITKGRQKYDRNGALAKRGIVSEKLLRQHLKHPYFRRKPPKTTGREEFGIGYSEQFCRTGRSLGLRDADIVATAAALTAETIIDGYSRLLPKMPDQVILCGGGANNPCLVDMLTQKLDGTAIFTTSDFGIDPDAKEALSFAILAWATIRGQASNVPSATGAAHPAVLGKIIPAGFSK